MSVKDTSDLPNTYTHAMQNQTLSLSQPPEEPESQAALCLSQCIRALVVQGYSFKLEYDASSPQEFRLSVKLKTPVPFVRIGEKGVLTPEECLPKQVSLSPNTNEN